LRLNGALFDAINDLAGRVTVLDRSMEWAARYAVFAIVLLVVASWFIHATSGTDRRLAVYTSVASAAISLAVAVVIQRYYVHQRPFVLRGDVRQLLPHSADPSFPSEHASAAFAMAAGLGMYRRWLGLAALVLAALTAFSRVYVGIHYPADVAAGAAIGVLVALALWFARPLLAWLDRNVVVRLAPAFLR